MDLTGSTKAAFNSFSCAASSREGLSLSTSLPLLLHQSVSLSLIIDRVSED